MNKQMIPLQRKDSLSVETAHKIARQQSYYSESTLSPITPQEAPEEFKELQIKVSVGAQLHDDSANNADAEMQQDSSGDSADEDLELITFQKQRSMPIVRLDSVNEDSEQNIIEIEDFSKLKDGEHKQIGLMSSGIEGQFA